MTVTPYFLSAAIQSDSIFGGRQKKKKNQGKKKRWLSVFPGERSEKPGGRCCCCEGSVIHNRFGGGHVAARGGKKPQQKYKKTHTCVVSLSHTRLHSSPAVKKLALIVERTAMANSTLSVSRWISQRRTSCPPLPAKPNPPR